MNTYLSNRNLNIRQLLQEHYGIDLQEADANVSGGADVNTVVKAVYDTQGNKYLLKIRTSNFDEMSLLVPADLSHHGVTHIIPPYLTKEQKPWVQAEGIYIALYPFIEGTSGTDLRLNEHNWVDFGKTMREIHNVELPPKLKSHLQIETFSDVWRTTMLRLLKRFEIESFTEPAAVALVEYINAKRNEISSMVAKAQRYADALKAKQLPLVLCHGDIHVANLIIDTHDKLYVIDWDTLLLAPKERDLMYVGGGIIRIDTDEEIQKFYEGYGETDIDYTALSYYRIERVIEDICAFCDQILSNQGSNEELSECLGYVKSNFEPHGTIEIAHKTEEKIHNS